MKIAGDTDDAAVDGFVVSIWAEWNWTCGIVIKPSFVHLVSCYRVLEATELTRGTWKEGRGVREERNSDCDNHPMKKAQ